MEYYSAIRTDKVMQFVDKWIRAEDIMLSEVRGTTDTECLSCVR